MRIGLSCNSIEPHIWQNKIDGIGVYTKSLLYFYQSQEQTIIPVSFPKNKMKQSHYTSGQLFSYTYISSTLASIFNFVSYPMHRNIEKKIDIFHATDHLLPKFSKVPLVATIHDGEMFKYQKWIKQRRIQQLKNWGRKKSLSWVRQYITISHAMVPELVNDCGIPEDKISVIYNGIAPWWFESITDDEQHQVKSKFKLPDKYILFTGTLNYRKNLSRLVSAYLELPIDIQGEFPLIVVGKKGWDSNDSNIALERLLAKQAGYWLDYVSDVDLRALFQMASLYVLPSLHEGFGLTILQSFASHTPVLTSNVAAMPEIANGAAFLVDPYSVDEIKAGLLQLLTTPSLCQRMVDKGFIRAHDFSWEQCAQQTLSLYNRVI